MQAISLAEIQRLFTQFSFLSTFAEVVDWDSRAAREVENLTNAISSIDFELTHRVLMLEQAKQERQQKSALSRILSGSGEEKKIQGEIDALVSQKSQYERFIEELKSKIDITPNNSEERTTMLKELQLEKKELQLKKRGINEQMRVIRTAARQQSVNLPNTFSGAFGGSKYRASERRSIRYHKEAALSPHEDDKSTIEQELLHLEKDILWVERFK